MMARLWACLGHPLADALSLLLALTLAGLALADLYASWRASGRLQARVAAATSELTQLRALAREVQDLRSETVPALSGSPLQRIEQSLQRHQLRPLVESLVPEGEAYVLRFQPLEFAHLARVIADVESATLMIHAARLERSASPGRVRAELRIGLRP